MGMLESLKEKIEKLTRWKRPSRDDLRHAVKARKPKALRFKDDGVIPNNPKLPFILYRGPVRLAEAYPASGSYDECRTSAAEHNRALRTIPKVALPRKDPVYGRDGPLTRLWRRT
jgi:uncharacterized protein YjlB